MDCLIVLPFLLQYLMKGKNVISSWSVMWELALMILSNSVYIYGVNLERRILNTFYMMLIAVLLHNNGNINFISLIVNEYNNRLLTLIRQFFLIPNSLWISDCNVSPPSWTISSRIWSLFGDLYFLNFAIVISNSKGLGSGTSSSAVHISICLASLTPMHVQ
jgi:hypothetical protein